MFEPCSNSSQFLRNGGGERKWKFALVKTNHWKVLLNVLSVSAQEVVSSLKFADVSTTKSPASSVRRRLRQQENASINQMKMNRNRIEDFGSFFY